MARALPLLQDQLERTAAMQLYPADTAPPRSILQETTPNVAQELLWI